MKKLILSSGNSFYYDVTTAERLASGWIISTNNVFLGGYLGKEANRKYNIFKDLKDVVVKDVLKPEGIIKLRDSSKEEFSNKLLSVSYIFKDSFFTDISDNTHSERAQACDERRHYYKAIGCSQAYQTNRKFWLGLLIANHVSVFSWKHFKETFFRGREFGEKDDSLEVSTEWGKWTYSKRGFKAPAAYVRTLSNFINA